jgi:hypothetical protein
MLLEVGTDQLLPRDIEHSTLGTPLEYLEKTRQTGNSWRTLETLGAYF